MRPSDWLRAAAVTYACLGYRVLPLHHPIPYSAAQGSTMCCSCGDPACGAVGKHPLTQHGLKDASSDPAQLTGWRRWPQANIGLVTGELADVLDVDGRPGRMALRRLAADHDLRLEGPLAETRQWLASLPRPNRQRDHRVGHQPAGHRRRRGLRWGRSVTGVRW
jgi:hypothetical protein